MQDIIRKELNEASEVVSAFVADSKNIEHIEKAVVLLATAFKIGNKVISCGNGGSMCDAMHFAEELSGRFRSDRAALPAMAISDPSHITCTANDYGFESIFSRYVEGFGNKGDVLFAISTSGNSNNIIKAAEVARSKEMKVIALTGKDGGKLANICDVEIRVPHMGYADRIQEIHIKVIHCMILGVEKALFG